MAPDKSLEQHALGLVERIYAAALDPRRWREFADAMAARHPSSAVGFALQLPGPSPGVYYGANFGEGIELEGQRLETFIRHTRRGLPWEEARRNHFVGRFGLGSEVFPDEQVADTAFYQEWMKPLGLAPVAPMGHTVALEEGRPVASVAIFRKGGGGPFRPQDLRLGNLLVPHLARAYAMHARVRESSALAEVLDRLPSGVLLIDASRRLVLANRAAQRVFALDDGFSCGDEGPTARAPAEDALLRKLIDEAIAAAASHRGDAPRSVGSVMSISRPSGRRAFPVMVSPLLSAPAESALRDAVAVLHISDLDAHSVARSDVLHALYGLTQAEIELVALLCDGRSLEEAAERRGVTMNTARSQLKKIFAKTGTSRQSELVRLVLAGIAPIGDPA